MMNEQPLKNLIDLLCDGEEKPAASVDPPMSKPKIDPATAAAVDPPVLKSKIDPSSIIVDWDVAIGSEDEGPEGQFGRPRKDIFVRAHPTWSTGVYLIDCKVAGGGLNSEFILSHEIAKFLLREDQPVSACKIYLLAVHKGGHLFWPVKLGDPTEVRSPAQHVKTALEAIERAQAGWCKIYWKNSVGKSGWKVVPAKEQLPDPVWPADPLALFLETISDRYIDQTEDPIVAAYLGAV